jgi:hypothetical protein
VCQNTTESCVGPPYSECHFGMTAVGLLPGVRVAWELQHEQQQVCFLLYIYI